MGCAISLSVERTNIALATAMEASVDSSRDVTCCRGQRESYTVKLWHLANKGGTITMNGKTWYWCVGDHYSCGKKCNGVYCLHDTAIHDTWPRDQVKQRYALRVAGSGSDVGCAISLKGIPYRWQRLWRKAWMAADILLVLMVRGSHTQSNFGALLIKVIL